MPKEIGEVFWKLINKIWKERGIPYAWNRGVISPIYKKGEKNEVKNYRGVTLMDTAYKIYANILNERLKREVERKLEEAQFGFRKERRTIECNICIELCSKQRYNNEERENIRFLCRSQGNI